MTDRDATSWTLIDAAAQGEVAARALFAERYLPVVRTYLGARWRDHALRNEIDDAAQEVFVDLLRERGALSRVDRARGSFRGFLYGVVRNVAFRCERRVARRGARAGGPLDHEPVADAPALADVFDRAWVANLLDLAVARHHERAAAQGEVGSRRVELLRLRFWDDLPVREIATRWGWDPAKVHKEYARARDDFRRALEDVVRWNYPAHATSVRAEVERLLALLP